MSGAELTWNNPTIIILDQVLALGYHVGSPLVVSGLHLPS